MLKELGWIVIFPPGRLEINDADNGFKGGNHWALFIHPSIECNIRLTDGRYLATGGADEVVRIWRLADRKLLRVFIPGTKVFCLAFSSDGRWMATGGQDRNVLVWDLSDGTIVASLEVGLTRCTKVTVPS